MRSTERGRRAVTDANLNEGWLDRDFSEAFGFELTPENAPEIYKLMTNMKEDAGDLATRTAKNHYMRPRPFMVFNEPSATPDDGSRPAQERQLSFRPHSNRLGYCPGAVGDQSGASGRDHTARIRLRPEPGDAVPTTRVMSMRAA